MRMKILKNYFILFSIISLHFLSVGDVGVIYNDKIPVYETIFSNFKNKLEDSGIKIKKIPVLSDEKNNTNEKKIEESIKASNCEYFFAIGLVAAKALKNSGCTGIFTMVVDPYTNGLIENNGSKKSRIIGILVNISPEILFSKIKLLMSEKNKIGIIYDPSVSGYVVSQYSKYSAEFGFQIFEVPVSDKSEIPAAIESLKDKIDFILSVVDNTVYNNQSLEIVFRFSILHRIPFVGFSSKHTKSVALASYYCDYPQLGFQAADLMKKFINGTDLKSITVEMSNAVKYTVNSKIAQLMKMKISETVISGAEENVK